MCSEMEKNFFCCLFSKVDVNSFSQSVGIGMDAHKSNVSRIMLLTALTTNRPLKYHIRISQGNPFSAAKQRHPIVAVVGWRETKENKMRNYGQRKGKRCHRDFGTLSLTSFNRIWDRRRRMPQRHSHLQTLGLWLHVECWYMYDDLDAECAGTMCENINTNKVRKWISWAGLQTFHFSGILSKYPRLFVLMFSLWTLFPL